jgi:UDP-N-acetylglucosamine 4,6-dehydratase/5-epimerase
MHSRRQSVVGFSGKTLLITGGTGSFGNAILDRFMKTEIDEIRIFSRDEKKQDEMRHRYQDSRLTFYIGDVRDPGAVQAAMPGVDCLFHAAALKQVPSCEFHPLEAVKTNVVGADNVLRAAAQEGVSRAVVLSTDKAAYPINAMGMTKGLMEKIMIARSRAASRRGLVYSGTRYGNVMASRGSVIPLFIQQIEEGRPLTVTDPTMTRFMMLLEEAVDLVLYAFEEADPGDIVVQKSPAATMETLAKAVLNAMEADNEIKIIGTRHGEKLYETLLTREERVRASDVGRFFRVPCDSRELDYALYVSKGEADVAQSVDYTSHNTDRLDLDSMTALLLKLPVVQAARARRGITD